jgi:hypothetical protein
MDITETHLRSYATLFGIAIEEAAWPELTPQLRGWLEAVTKLRQEDVTGHEPDVILPVDRF